MTAQELIDKWPEDGKPRGWFHQIELGDGIKTPGSQDTAYTAQRVKLPEDLDGRRVLDIGFNDGYFAFECEKRGAFVDGIDPFPDIGLDVKEYLDSQVNLEKGDLFTWKKPKGRKYDLVLCMGVVYHVKDIIGAFERLYHYCDDMLILETHVATGLDVIKNPIARFYPGSELNDDETNYWGCNCQMIDALIKHAGFKITKFINLWNDRYSIHAWKE